MPRASESTLYLLLLITRLNFSGPLAHYYASACPRPAATLNVITMSTTFTFTPQLLVTGFASQAGVGAFARLAGIWAVAKRTYTTLVAHFGPAIGTMVLSGILTCAVIVPAIGIALIVEGYGKIAGILTTAGGILLFALTQYFNKLRHQRQTQAAIQGAAQAGSRT
ncbi:hypothetical protein JCM10296v2_007768 [Rhodotorula toruloides]